MNNEISKEEIFSDKELREGLEIGMFLDAYNKKCGSDFKVFQRREKPDYLIKDSKDNILGVELTSVYINDKVVGEEHKKDGTREIPFDLNTHQDIRNRYFNRIIVKVEEKANKIKEGKYDTTHQIILSVYLNDYYVIHIDSAEWKSFIDLNNKVFSKRNEFKEVFFYK